MRKKQKAILVTKDIEFGSFLTYPKNSHYGLLILRLPYYFSTEQITSSLQHFLTTTKPQQLINNITVLELGRYRTRQL